jgi:hypothetical protein
MQTLGEVRAALASGFGFPGDAEQLEAALALELSRAPLTDLSAVSEVIATYRGRVLLQCDPDYDLALAEAAEALRTLQGER